MKTTFDSLQKPLRTDQLKTLGRLLQRTQNLKKSFSLQIIYPSGMHLAMLTR